MVRPRTEIRVELEAGVLFGIKGRQITHPIVPDKPALANEKKLRLVFW
jgi:hypothetical protein